MIEPSRIAAFARDELGLELTPAQGEMLSTFEAGGHSQAAWQCGRRGGKSLLSDVLVIYDSVVRDDLRERMLLGEERISAVICPRLDQATAHVRNVLRLMQRSPRLAGLIDSDTTEEIRLVNGSVIKAFPCSSRSVRGGAWSCVVLDEFAHFVDVEQSNNAGDSVWQAVLPAGAQFGADAWIIAISTPRWRQGAFFKLTERARGGRAGHIHYRRLTTAEMNPAIPAAWLEERRVEDPDLYRREFAAEFVDALSAYLQAEAVRACVRQGVNVLPPVEGTRYTAALDVAYAADRTALVIGHQGGDAVIDGCWTWFRAGHEGMLAEVAAVCERYGIRSVVIDQFAEQPVREGLAKHGIEADYKPWTNQSKSDALGRLKAAVNTASIELPDDAELVSELCSLEAKALPSGMTRIAASGSGHDDRAMALAAVIDALTAPSGVLVLNMSDPEEFDPGPGQSSRMAAAGWRRWDGESAITPPGPIEMRCATCGAPGRVHSSMAFTVGCWPDCDYRDMHWRPLPVPA